MVNGCNFFGVSTTSLGISSLNMRHVAVYTVLGNALGDRYDGGNLRGVKKVKLCVEVTCKSRDMI